MKYEAASINEFVRATGTQRVLVPVMTALALATSGGHSSYEVRAGVPGAGHYMGLWGVDVDRFPFYAEIDHHDPWAAADAAVHLTITQRTLDWSPAAVAGHGVRFLELAHAGMSMAPFQEHVESPVASYVAGQHATPTPRHLRSA